jgi:hypothetical protein
MIKSTLHIIKDAFSATGGALLLICLCTVFLSSTEVAEAKVYEGDGVYFYGIQNDATPYTKDYLVNSNSFGATTTTAVGSTTPIVSVVKSSPTKPELISGYVNASGTLQVMCYDGTTWSHEWSASVGGSGTTTKFDIGYETSTGNAMVLYSSNASSSNELVYRTKTGTSTCGTSNWSGATNLDPVRSSGVVLWVKIATDPRATSSLMTAIWADSNRDLSAMTWSGSTWGNEHSAALETDLEVVSVAQDTQSFDVAYESLSGDVMVVWGSGGTNGTNGGYYAVCTGGIASCTWASVRTAMPTLLDDATHISIAADPLSDQIAFASVGNAGADTQAGIWSGTSWTNQANTDTIAAAPTAGRMFVATGWLTSGGTKRAVATYYDSGATNVGWMMHNGTTWAVQTDSTPTISFGTQTQYKIEVNPHDRSQLMFIVSNSTRQAFAKRLSMNSAGTFTWTQPDSGLVVSGLGSDIYRSMDFAYWRYVTPDYIGGTLYTDFGVTTASSGKTIKLAIGTSTPTVYSTTTNASGVWRISDITDFSAVSTTTPFTAWLDGDASDATTLYTGYVSGDISDIPLYYDHAIIYASSSSTTVDMASFGVYDATDDADILFNVSGSTTTVSANLLISKGTVTPTNSLVIAGDYINNATVTAGSGLMVFSGSNKIISGRLTGSNALNTAVITGSYTVATTTASTSNLIVEAGASLTATGTLSVSAALTNRGTLLMPGGDVTVVDFITATSASTTAPSTLRLSGDFTNNGDFIAGTGTVLLGGVGQLLTSAATTTFYNLTKSVTAADTLTFGAGGEYAVSGTVILTGLENNLLTLRSSTPGQFWYIDAQATRTLAWLDVQDSYNSAPEAMNCPAGCIDSGNNINWFILTLYGTIYSDEGTSELMVGGLTVSARIGGVTYSTTTSAGTGFWYISGYPAPITASSVVPVWIDNNASYKAALFARANGAIIPDANLYLDNVILRDDTGTTSPLLNAHVSGYAGGDDADLLLTFGPEVTTDATLYIYDNTYYQADTELILGASLKAADTARADFSAVNVTMTSTSTAAITGVPLLGNVEFSGAGGEFSFGSAATTSNLTVATSSNLTVAEQIKINGNFVNAGTVTATDVLRFNGHFTNNGDFVSSAGRLIFEGTNKTIGGSVTGANSLKHVLVIGSYSVSSGAASTTDLQVSSTGNLEVPGQLTVAGKLSNYGTFDTTGNVNMYMGSSSRSTSLQLKRVFDVDGTTDGNNTGDTLKVLVHGNLLYTANLYGSTTADCAIGLGLGCELHVYDISDPNNSSFIKGTDVSGTTTGQKSLIIKSLAVAGNTLFVGTYGSGAGGNQVCSVDRGSCELQVYDISSSTDPTYVTGRDIGGSATGTLAGGAFAFGSYVTDLVTKDSFLYLLQNGSTTPCTQVNATSGAVGCELQVYDISSSTNPVYVAGRDISANATGTSLGYNVGSIKILGDYLYMSAGGAAACSQIAGSASGCELQVYDISSSTNPIYLAGHDLSDTQAGVTNTAIKSIEIEGNYVYVTKPFGNFTTCITTPGAVANCELYIYDISSPEQPRFVSAYELGDRTLYDLAVTDATLYIAKQPGSNTCMNGTLNATSGCSLIVFDVTNVNEIKAIRARTEVGSRNIFDVALHNGFVYLGQDDSNTSATGPCGMSAGSAVQCTLLVYSQVGSVAHGTFTNSSKFKNMSAVGGVDIVAVATTSDVTSNGVVHVFSDITIEGDYQNNSEIKFNSTQQRVYFDSSAAQSIQGTLFGTSSLPEAVFKGVGKKTFYNTASTSNLVIDAAAEVEFSETVQVSGLATNRGALNILEDSKFKRKLTNFGDITLASSTSLESDYENNGSVIQTGGAFSTEAFMGGYIAGRTLDGATTSPESGNLTTLLRHGNYLYVGAEDYWATPCSDVPGSALGCEIQIYDMTDPDTPVYVSGIDTNGSLTGSEWGHVRKFFREGNYLYVAKAGDPTACSQVAGSADGCEIQIYDVTNHESPVYVVGRDASGSGSGTGSSAVVDIVTYDNMLYVAKDADSFSTCTETAGSADGCILQVYDLSSSTNPTLVAGRDAHAGSGVSRAQWTDGSALEIVNGYLYFATWGITSQACSQVEGSALGCEIKIYDISSSTDPVYIAGRDGQGNTDGVGSMIGYDFLQNGGYLYVAKNGDASYPCVSGSVYKQGCELQIYDISSTTNPSFVSGVDSSGAADVSLGSQSLLMMNLQGDYIYTAYSGDTTICSQIPGEATGCEIKVFDVSNPASPQYILGYDSSAAMGVEIDVSTVGVAVSENYVAFGKSFDYYGPTVCSVSDPSGCDVHIFSLQGLYHTSPTSTNQLGNLHVHGTGLKFTANATTSDLTIGSGAVVEAPDELVVRGDFVNQGRFNAKNGTTTFAGTGIQTATGTLASTSAFNNLVITNTSGNGNGTQSVVFTGPLKVNDTFKMVASSSAAFAAGATTTLQNISLEGEAGQYVWLRSTEIGNPWKLDVPGERRQVTHVHVKDSNACNGNPEISAVDGTSVDAGGNSCWDFGNTPGALSLQSVSDQTFTINQVAAEISPIVVTSASSTAITATDDLRITIATSSVNMRFDVTDTTAVFAGVAAAKVSTTVSYENNGATLVLDVLSDFSADDVISISGLSYTDFGTINAAAAALTLYTGGASDVGVDATDTNTVTIVGSLTLEDHGEGQVTDGFALLSRQEIPLYRYTLDPLGETIRVHTTTIVLDGVNGIVEGDVTNLKLYKDTNRDGNFDGEDTLLANAAAFTLVEQSGSITFSTTYNISTTSDLILIGDVANVRPDDQMNVRLNVESITATGLTTSGTVIPSGAASRIQHNRGGGGTRSIPSLSAIGGDAPAGGSNETGGDDDGGAAEIGVDTNTGGTELGDLQYFSAPSQSGTPLGEWVSGISGINSDGVYTTASTTNLRQSFSGFTFGIPGGNEILGIEVKLEASATTNAGEIEIKLSWDGGSTQTTAKTTGTLTNLDAVYTLGGSADLWGHAWTPAELTSGTFNLEITGQPNTNTVQVDAIRVRIYHQATGGGVGGGGGEVRRPGLLPLAGALINSDVVVAGHVVNLQYTLSLLAVTLEEWLEQQK